MPKLVRVQPSDFGLVAAPPKQLGNTAVGQTALGTKPERGRHRARMSFARPPVPVEGRAARRAVGHGSRATALADNVDYLKLSVEVFQTQVNNLG